MSEPVPCVAECDGNGVVPCWHCLGSPDCGCDGISCGGDGEMCDYPIDCGVCGGDGHLPCGGDLH